MPGAGSKLPKIDKELLTADGWRLFSTRMVRLFAYGFISIVLVLYLAEVGLTEPQIGLLLTLTLVGDTLFSLWITTRADRAGRRRMLIWGAGLMVFAGTLLALTGNFWLLLVAATLGVISPSGNEVGPFLAIEQAALAQAIPGVKRARVFAWYNLVGSFATALGSLAGGGLAQLLQSGGLAPLQSYRMVVVGYAALGVVLGLLFKQLSAKVEAPVNPPATSHLGLHRSRPIVLRLSALFWLDAFAGGFVVQSLVAYWFQLRYGVEPALLGGIFFGANILAGVSALAAGWAAERVGLLNTMVFTHIPSNVLLMLAPLAPNLPLAVTILLLRFSISQMDVPTRQAYTLAVVTPDERSAAAGVTGIARTLGAALAPVFTGMLLGSPLLLNAPFFLAGGLKVIYDLILYRLFRQVKLSEEA